MSNPLKALPASMLARLAVRALVASRKSRSQYSVEITIPLSHLLWSVDDFDERYIFPSMRRLAEQIPRGYIRYLDLPLPESSMAASLERYEDIVIRLVVGSVASYEGDDQGNLVEKATDKVKLRFDVLIEESF